MTVVFDTNVFVSAAISATGPSQKCFYYLAKRKFALAISAELLEEYREAAESLSKKQGRYHGLEWRSLYDWVSYKAIRVEPAPLGKQRSRDIDDDAVLACALGAQAKMIVSHDEDLLDLRKPFGIEVLTPSAFVTHWST